MGTLLLTYGQADTGHAFCAAATEVKNVEKGLKLQKDTFERRKWFPFDA